MEFTIFLQNVRSIHKNFELLEHLIESVQSKPTVIALTETWCKENCSPNAYNLNVYGKLLRCDRETRGGGVVLYVGNKYDIFIFRCQILLLNPSSVALFCDFS